MCEGSNSWNLNILLDLFPPEVVFEIRKIHISSSPEPKRLIWTPSSSGVFSSKSAYHLSQKCRFGASLGVLNFIFKNLWAAKIHSRSKLFLWKLIHNILPTKGKLRFLFSVELINCPFCDLEEESIEHLFLRCPFTKAVWFKSKWSFRLDSFSNEPLIGFLILILDSKSRLFPGELDCLEFLIFAAILMEFIWARRNQIVHGKPIIEFDKFLKLVEAISAEHFFAQKLWITSSKAPSYSIVWSPPRPNGIKVNSDASFKNGLAAFAVIIRNSNGSILFAAASKQPCLSPLAAECLSLHLACSILMKWKIDEACIENDCLQAIFEISNDWQAADWSARDFIEEIRKFWSCWPKWRFKFAPRNSNFAAHNLAAWAFESGWSDPSIYAALQALKSSWKNLPPNWVGADPCGGGWVGLSCTNNRVVSITLASINLSGQLSDIATLEELQILDLSYNKGMTGPIPATIGDAKKLSSL
ncbi:hypothetical protein RD792_015948 [Penstemon davidsonii]|uniref:Reverse transcriptase zinc-binding domain-containing protein n=1 Tax=Penstemon davidsonii TaxID=160366 RepID=A0ABR0CJQ8_9LAMI|nr:hypothetical protein RD792_015948 [Penstemon davidsonii]